MKKRNQYSPEFKAQVVLEVLREESTINEIAGRHDISPVMLSRWKTEFLDRAAKAMYFSLFSNTTIRCIATYVEFKLA